MSLPVGRRLDLARHSCRAFFWRALDWYADGMALVWRWCETSPGDTPPRAHAAGRGLAILMQRTLHSSGLIGPISARIMLSLR